MYRSDLPEHGHRSEALQKPAFALHSAFDQHGVDSVPVEDEGGDERAEVMVPVEREGAAPHVHVWMVSAGLHVVEEESTFPDPAQIYLMQPGSLPRILPQQTDFEGVLGV